MNPVQALKIYRLVNQLTSLNKKGAPAMTYIPLIVTLLCTLCSALAVPSFVQHHVMLYAILNAIAQVLHSALPTPTVAGNSSKAGKVGAFVLLGLLVAGSSRAMAQTTTAATNLYGAGVSYNQAGTPGVAGTGIYAHLLSDSSGTYAFTVIDLLPNNNKTFSVSTNIGAGLAQKIVTIGKVPIFIPTSAGISISGSNTGWAWSTGGMAVIALKNNWKIMPNVRVVKSSVTNGTGYQPVIGIMFGWAS